jgi:drug/metabolite transporter (DMT)-like permease
MPTRTRRPAAGLIWVALLTLYFVWGSTYLGIRVAVETIPPFLMAGSRFVLAGLVMFGFALVHGRGRISLPTVGELRDSLVVGSLLMGGGMGMVALGEETVPSGIAALVIAMLPLWIAVLGRVFFGELLPRAAIAGVAIGLTGVAILVGPSSVAAESFNAGGVAALIISPICWATGSLFSSHRARLPKDPLVATSAQMLLGGGVLMIMAGIRGEYAGFRPDAVAGDSLLAFAYLVVVGSLIGFTAYVWLLRVAPLPLIATYAYVNPIVAVALGALILQEPITPRTLVAGAVIIFAVALIITSRSRMARSATQADAAAPARAARPIDDHDPATEAA